MSRYCGRPPAPPVVSAGKRSAIFWSSRSSRVGGTVPPGGATSTGFSPCGAVRSWGVEGGEHLAGEGAHAALGVLDRQPGEAEARGEVEVADYLPAGAQPLEDLRGRPPRLDAEVQLAHALEADRPEEIDRVAVGLVALGRLEVVRRQLVMLHHARQVAGEVLVGLVLGAGRVGVAVDEVARDRWSRAAPVHGLEALAVGRHGHGLVLPGALAEHDHPRAEIGGGEHRVGRHGDAVEPVAEPAHRRGADRGPWLAVVRALPLDPAALEGVDHHAGGLVEAVARLVHRDAETLLLPAGEPAPDAE